MKVYEETEEELATQNNAVFAFLINVSYKRRIFEVFLDAFLITLSYYAAYALQFGRSRTPVTGTSLSKPLPLLVVIKLFAFLAVGVYRGIWRYTSIGDFITFTKGVVVGSVLSVWRSSCFIVFKIFRVRFSCSTLSCFSSCWSAAAWRSG